MWDLEIIILIAYFHHRTLGLNTSVLFKVFGFNLVH